MTTLPLGDVFSEDEGLDEPTTFMGEVSVYLDNSENCNTKRFYIESNQDKRLLIVLWPGLTYPKGKALLDHFSDSWYAHPTVV